MTYKIALVGEAWGEHEERERAPFVGPAGWQLNTMLAEAGIARRECFLTNCLQPATEADEQDRKSVRHAQGGPSCAPAAIIWQVHPR